MNVYRMYETPLTIDFGSTSDAGLKVTYNTCPLRFVFFAEAMKVCF